MHVYMHVYIVNESNFKTIILVAKTDPYTILKPKVVTGKLLYDKFRDMVIL